jgi:Leucine-rich repeat (LRR) protein
LTGSLTLTGGDIPNGYPINIEKLAGLTSLSITGSILVDIQFVKSMPDLEELNLSNNEIKDISANNI